MSNSPQDQLFSHPLQDCHYRVEIRWPRSERRYGSIIDRQGGAADCKRLGWARAAATKTEPPGPALGLCCGRVSSKLRYRTVQAPPQGKRGAAALPPKTAEPPRPGLACLGAAANGRRSSSEPPAKAPRAHSSASEGQPTKQRALFGGHK